MKSSRKKLYEGSTKILYQTEEDSTLIQFFKDDFVLNKKKKIEIDGKGAMNNSISAFIMQKLDLVGISTHLIEKINMREQCVQVVDVLPIQVEVSNISYGRYVTQFGIKEGYVFNRPLVDFMVKNIANELPIINENQIMSFGWLTKKEIDFLTRQSIRVNDFLSGLFAGHSMRLVSCKLEFGKVFSENQSVLMLADEISPDNCRIWDMNTNEKIDYEYVIKNPDKATYPYKEITKRLKLNLT